MPGDRSRYGLSMSSLGAAALAVSVFLPWYRVGTVDHGALRALPGHSLTILGYHEALPVMKVVLLVLAALALLDAVLPLVRLGAPVPGGAGSAVALIGAVAAACALYRIIVLPSVAARSRLAAGGSLARAARLPHGDDRRHVAPPGRRVRPVRGDRRRCLDRVGLVP